MSSGMGRGKRVMPSQLVLCASKYSKDVSIHVNVDVILLGLPARCSLTGDLAGDREGDLHKRSCQAITFGHAQYAVLHFIKLGFRADRVPVPAVRGSRHEYSSFCLYEPQYAHTVTSNLWRTSKKNNF